MTEYTVLKSQGPLVYPPLQDRHSFVRQARQSVGTASDRSAARRAGRMGIFTLGKSSPVATEVPRRAYINQPAHPSHKFFCDNSMVRRGPLLAPHTWLASCLPHISRRSASHGRRTWLLPRPRPHNRDLPLTLTPETASAAAAENGKVRLPLGPMGARGAGAVPQLLAQVHHHLRPHQDALPLLPSHLCAAGPHTAALLPTRLACLPLSSV